MPGETIILDPSSEPLALTGTSVDHGIYLLEHEYPEPEKVDVRSGSARSTGRKGALNGYGNRIITTVLRVAEPPRRSVFDDFSANSIADYVFDAGAGTLAVSGGKLAPSSTVHKRLFHAARPFLNPDVTIKYTTGPAVTNDVTGILLKRLNSNTFIDVYNFGGGSLGIETAVAGVFNAVAADSTTGTPTKAPNTTYWLRARLEGNLLTVEHWTTDPALGGTPAATATKTLTGSDATTFGDGISGYSGLYLTPNVDIGIRYDDLKIGDRTIPGADPVTGQQPAVGGPLFQAILQQLEQKCERMTRRGGDEGVGGCYKRTLPGGQTILFDVVRATPVVTTSRLFAKGRAEVRVEFECLPLGYADTETDHGDNVETVLPVLIFEETIDGTAPALGRLVVDEDQNQLQEHVMAAVQVRRRSADATAALFYQAESRTPLGTAVASSAAPSASGSGNTTIFDGSLSPAYRAIFSTQASGGGAHLTHVGRYLVVARIYLPTTNTGAVKVAWEWGQGDRRQFTQNDEVALYPDASNPGGWEGSWRRVFLGTVDLDPATVPGSQRWEGRLLAKSTVAGDDIHIDWIELWPIDEFYAEAAANVQAPSPTSWLARDEFDQVAGALNAKVLPVGGSWATSVSALGDFQVETTGKTAQRTVNNDTGEVAGGRFAIAGATNYTDIFVMIDRKISANGAGVGALVARWIDANTHVRLQVPNGLSSTFNAYVWYGAGPSNFYSLGPPVPISVVAGAWYTFAMLITADGRLRAWVVPQGTDLGDPQIVAYDTALATGGTNATGKPGFYDAYGSGGTITRNFDNFAAFAPVIDAAMFPQQSLQFRHDAVVREDSAGAIWTPVSSHEGDLLTIPPSGRERQPARIMVKGQRFHPDSGPDIGAAGGADDISARLFSTKRFLSVPGPL